MEKVNFALTPSVSFYQRNLKLDFFINVVLIFPHFLSDRKKNKTSYEKVNLALTPSASFYHRNIKLYFIISFVSVFYHFNVTK